MSRKLIMCVILLVIPVFVFAGELLYQDALERYNNGLKEQQAGRFENAESEYKRALMLMGPQAGQLEKYVLNNAGLMAVHNGDFESAESCFLSALQIDPRYKTAASNLGLLYLRKGDSAKALEVWSKLFNLPDKFIVEGEKTAEDQNIFE